MSAFLFACLILYNTLMNILISNDDGIDAVGLRTLVKILSEIADVYICAPDAEKSGFAHHFTLKGSMKIEEREVEGAKKAYALSATPADCVHCGLLFIFKDIPFDLVISGINRGWNVSSDVVYSGTVAAAREGFIQGIPSIAISLNTYEKADYSFPAEVAKDIALRYLNDPDCSRYFLNVNVPFLPKDECKGYAICEANGYIRYDEKYFYEEKDGETYITTGKCETEIIPDENNECDICMVNDGYITISPLDNDEIVHAYIGNAKAIAKDL